MYILISHFAWLSQWFIILDINNLVIVYERYWMLLKLSIKWNQHEYQNGGITFQTREVQLGIPRNMGTNPYMSTYVETVSCEKFFSRKYSRRAYRFYFFIKQISRRNGDHDDLEFTNAFILCNLLWKVQKNLAANKEGSFNDTDTNTFFGKIYPM